MFSFDSFTEEDIFLFILCYSYNLNMAHIRKLYELSSSLFRSYLKAFLPMFRISSRKLVSIHIQATRIHKVLNGVNNEKLSNTDLHLIKIISQHLNNIYVCGNRYLTLEDLEGKEVYGIDENNNSLLINLDNRINQFNHVSVDGYVFTKTSPISFLLVKYFSDRNSREILNMGLLDLHKEIESMVKRDEEVKEI